LQVNKTDLSFLKHMVGQLHYQEMVGYQCSACKADSFSFDDFKHKEDYFGQILLRKLNKATATV
jgi:hypothetical protein